MTAPTQRAGGLDANARGLAVLGAAVLIGFLLLLKAGGGGGDAQAVSTGSTTTTIDTSNIGGETTTTVPGAGTEITTTTAATGGTARPVGEVTVLVLNGSGLGGVAKTNSETIGAAGYQMGAPANANAQIDTTAVYYAEGYQTEATAVAAVLGKEASVVAAMPTPPPGPGAESANVVVVLGKDTSPSGGGDAAGTTTTTTG